jgi:hypothetical protein
MKRLPSLRPVSAISGRKKVMLIDKRRRVQPFTRTVGRLIGQRKDTEGIGDESSEIFFASRGS